MRALKPNEPKVAGRFYRTCQECMAVVEAKDPAQYPSESWRNLKCPKCKSEELDYGSCFSEPDEYE